MGIRSNLEGMVLATLLGTYHVTVDFNDNLMGNYSVDGEFHGIFM
jgi:hypothetical protein